MQDLPHKLPDDLSLRSKETKGYKNISNFSRDSTQGPVSPS